MTFIILAQRTNNKVSVDQNGEQPQITRRLHCVKRDLYVFMFYALGIVRQHLIAESTSFTGKFGLKSLSAIVRQYKKVRQQTWVRDLKRLRAHKSDVVSAYLKINAF